MEAEVYLNAVNRALQQTVKFLTNRHSTERLILVMG